MRDYRGCAVFLVMMAGLFGGRSLVREAVRCLALLGGFYHAHEASAKLVLLLRGKTANKPIQFFW